MTEDISLLEMGGYDKIGKSLESDLPSGWIPKELIGGECDPYQLGATKRIDREYTHSAKIVETIGTKEHKFIATDTMIKSAGYYFRFKSIDSVRFKCENGFIYSDDMLENIAPLSKVVMSKSLETVLPLAEKIGVTEEETEAMMLKLATTGKARSKAGKSLRDIGKKMSLVFKYGGLQSGKNYTAQLQKAMCDDSIRKEKHPMGIHDEIILDPEAQKAAMVNIHKGESIVGTALGVCKSLEYMSKRHKALHEAQETGGRIAASLGCFIGDVDTSKLDEKDDFLDDLVKKIAKVNGLPKEMLTEPISTEWDNEPDGGGIHYDIYDQDFEKYVKDGILTQESADIIRKDLDD